MAASGKVGGGVNNMHLTNGKAPGMKAGRPKMAHMTGMGASPGGEGNKISANAVRGPVKGSISGPGIAK